MCRSNHGLLGSGLTNEMVNCESKGAGRRLLVLLVNGWTATIQKSVAPFNAQAKQTRMATFCGSPEKKSGRVTGNRKGLGLRMIENLFGRVKGYPPLSSSSPGTPRHFFSHIVDRILPLLQLAEPSLVASVSFHRETSETVSRKGSQATSHSLPLAFPCAF